MALACAASLPGARARAADEALFAITEIPEAGRVIQADLVDLDGDGRGDLLTTVSDGMPPDESRAIEARFQRPDGTLPAAADWSGPVPRGAAAYDLADLDGQPGVEMVLLRRDRLTLLSLSARTPHFRDLPVPGPTLAVAGDERGLDRLRIVRSGLGAAPRLLVPMLGETLVLTPAGQVVGRLAVGGRANYFVPPRPGLVVAESEMELYFDHPRLGVGDVDGDGRGDIVATTRHELRVFRQREDGSFPSEPDLVHAFHLLALEDHIRSSGSVRVALGDVDGDGRVDLLVSTTRGSLFAGETTLTLHRNRGAGWDFATPDQVFHTNSGLTAAELVDLSGDGVPELVLVTIPTGVLEIVEVLLTRAIDAQVKVYRRGGERLFEATPWSERKLDVPVSLETFRAEGFVPNADADLNGDGRRDFVDSGGGTAIEVHLGEADRAFGPRAGRQVLPTDGRIRFGDYDGDPLADFALYDPRRPGAPVRVGVNRGILPGSVRPPSLAPKPEGR
jgi:FG-GAP-like repeat